jgi:hypothetical protein
MNDSRLTPELARRLTLDTEPWLSCDDCFALIDEYVERMLDDPRYDHHAMRAHLRGCAACADEAVSLLELAAHDRGVDPQPAVARFGLPAD